MKLSFNTLLQTINYNSVILKLHYDRRSVVLLKFKLSKLTQLKSIIIFNVVKYNCQMHFDNKRI